MQVKNKFKKRGAFTIVELLTVMSVIIILISLLVPALNQVKRISKKVVQKKQFNSIDVALEMYEAEHGEYPPSDKEDVTGADYCGAMKLAEAMIGQDQLGFHRNSSYRADLMDSKGNQLYMIPGGGWAPPESNLKARQGPYLPVEYANAQRMGDDPGGGNYFGIYEGTQQKYKPFEWYHLVLCDVYTRRIQGTSIKAGMPILYYRANTGGKKNPRYYNEKYNGVLPNDPANIYNHEDNDELVKLGIMWKGGNMSAVENKHPMASDYPEGSYGNDEGLLDMFYFRINNNEVPIETGRPYKADSYILLSAGFDGEYGTSDDIFNFD
jgi:type II secretory pathway pseudopilin PulG